MANFRLVLTNEAEYDLQAIYEDGFKNWGEAQADIYYDAILKHFDALCDNPYLYQKIDNVRQGYRRSVCGNHSVYYRINDKVIEVMGLVRWQNRFFREEK